MKFTVIKASIDGLSGGDSAYDLDEVVREIFDCTGWATLKRLQAAIRKWAKTAKPGGIFRTHSSAIVVRGCSARSVDAAECENCGSRRLTFSNFDYDERGTVEQRVYCETCRRHVADVFALAERRVIKPGIV